LTTVMRGRVTTVSANAVAVPDPMTEFFGQAEGPAAFNRAYEHDG
jgi:hypothetical protein